MISPEELENVKLLVVGAGGIGCELLKNLVLTGFKHIEVIDLDTIELSNLNRQFLFQKNHLGQSKALIAKNSVLKFNPDANIIARHDTIMNFEYNVDYFKQFNIVLNALDNKAARSHVNRLCLTADVPLIESGSAGYLGQVTVIKKGLTECYDCLPKQSQKSYPGCTIRNTPSEPIHCIVWAKHLFNQLFGAEDPDEAVSPDTEDPENGADAGVLAAQKENSELVRVSTRTWAKEHGYDPKKIFNKLFNEDVKYLLSMTKLWEKRKPPVPLDYDKINSELNDNLNNDGVLLSTQRVWTLKECLDNFSQSILALKDKLNEQKNDDNQILVWDKDDEECLNFTTASANLRSHLFSIELKSKFDVKSLAGNIIPAIATTNAIIAGLIVLQAIKIIKNKFKECKTVFLRDSQLQQKLIVPTDLVEPNKKCYVCALQPSIIVKLNLSTATINYFETKILKYELNMVQPDVEIDDGTGRIMISSEEGETNDSNDKVLSSYGLRSGSVLKCDDFFQNLQITVILVDCEKFEDSKEYEIIANDDSIKSIQKISKDNHELPSTSTNDLIYDENDDVHFIENKHETSIEKRKRLPSVDNDKELEILTKKRKLLNDHDKSTHLTNNKNGIAEHIDDDIDDGTEDIVCMNNN